MPVVFGGAWDHISGCPKRARASELLTLLDRPGHRLEDPLPGHIGCSINVIDHSVQVRNKFSDSMYTTISLSPIWNGDTSVILLILTGLFLSIWPILVERTPGCSGKNPRKCQHANESAAGMGLFVIG
jgi:hypothetical protein